MHFPSVLLLFVVLPLTRLLLEIRGNLVHLHVRGDAIQRVSEMHKVLENVWQEDLDHGPQEVFERRIDVKDNHVGKPEGHVF